MKITIEFNSVEEYLKLKDAQEGKDQEQFLMKELLNNPVIIKGMSGNIDKQIFKPCSSDRKVYNDSESISNPFSL